jgi:hypothetical protein
MPVVNAPLSHELLCAGAGYISLVPCFITGAFVAVGLAGITFVLATAYLPLLAPSLK